MTRAYWHFVVRQPTVYARVAKVSWLRAAMRRTGKGWDIAVVPTVNSQHRLSAMTPILFPWWTFAVSRGITKPVRAAHCPHRDGALANTIGEFAMMVR